MLTAVAHVAASRPSAVQHPLAPAPTEQQREKPPPPTMLGLLTSTVGMPQPAADANPTVHRLNQLFDAGHPSNDVSRAGLVVHQHDNTEGWERGIYMPQADSGFAERWSTSFVSRQYPGTYLSLIHI